jgi:hypothetical protein
LENPLKKTTHALVAATLTAAAGAVVAADFSDTYIGFRRGSSFSEPGISQDVPKNIITFGHFSAYKYGTNFFNLDILKSLENDPARGGGGQAQELYFAYRTSLSLAKVTGQKWNVGPVSGFALTGGIDAGTKDTQFAPKPFKFLLGPTANFGLPWGFVDVSLFLYKESNYNGIVAKDVSFDATWQLNAVWGTSFSLGLPATFKGFLAMTGPKGKDGFGAETETETLARMALLWDIGTVGGLNKGTVLAGFGYEYWKNKFGNPSSVPGTKTSALTLNAEWHF